MNYQSTTIQAILSQLNVNYFLPAIQREYVWHPDQIIQLFDSIMRDYPIGSFLFWQLDESNLYKWDVYRFVQDYKQYETHNTLASVNGVSPLYLVLDGQQRLTSLLIGLKGSYTIKKKWFAWSNPGAWSKQKIYLDLFKDPKSDADGDEEDIRYGFRLMETAPAISDESYWFEVGRILNFKSKDSFEAFLDQEQDKFPNTVTKGQMKVFTRNLTRLYDAIWNDYCIAYFTEQDQNYDRVLTIFVRANQGGTKLSKSDLLLSMVTAKWDDMNARDEIYDFVDQLNNGLAHRNDFDKDFVMKTSLVLSDLPVQYKVENFNNHNLEVIHRRWKGIKAALEVAVNLVNSFGIDRDTLMSANALIPIIYYLYQHQGMTLQSSSTFDAKNASRIRRWLLEVLLNNTFSGQSDRALTDTRRAISEQLQHDKDFPADAINAALRRSGRKVSLDEDTIDTILSLSYGKPTTFLGLSLLYDQNNWGSTGYHQDHIFPQATFTRQNMSNAGISAEQQKRYMELVNRIGNLELLTSQENQEKSDQDFGQWIVSRDKGFRTKHCIPVDSNLYTFSRFEEFIAEREKLIRERLQQKLLTV